jgi:pSer/pThr/pTyr-binding forkhead associated (FHA) protein
MGKLLVFLPDGTMRPVNLGKERVVIGRRADNDVCLPFPAVSSEHAAVVTILDDSFLEDLDSTNGTLVNGKAIQKHFLRDRDQIDIGQQKLIYLSDDLAPIVDENIDTVRNELKTFGEKVQRANTARRTRDTRVDVSADEARNPAKSDDAAPAERVEPFFTQAELSADAARMNALPGEKSRPEAEFAADLVEPLAGAAPKLLLDLPPPELSSSIRRRPAIKSESTVEQKADRLSTDRGLDEMARIRSSESGNGAHENGANGNGKRPSSVDTIAESLARATGVPAKASGAPVVEMRSPPARITVLSGANAGRSLIIERNEVVIGRVGLQVVAIQHADNQFRLYPREGDVEPTLNGSPVDKDGALLSSGDTFEVAGARIEFIAKPR